MNFERKFCKLKNNVYLCCRKMSKFMVNNLHISHNRSSVNHKGISRIDISKISFTCCGFFIYIGYSVRAFFPKLIHITLNKCGNVIKTTCKQNPAMSSPLTTGTAQCHFLTLLNLQVPRRIGAVVK